MNTFTVTNELFINAELINSLNVDSDLSQPDDALFEKILSSLLGTLHLQQRHTIFYETKGNIILSQTQDAHEKEISPCVPSIINKNYDYISSESKLKGFSVEQENQILDYNHEEMHLITLFFKEIYNYLLYSGQLHINSEQIEQYLHEANIEAHPDFNRGTSLPLKNYAPQILERISSLWQTSEDSKGQPLNLTKTFLPFIPDQRQGYSGNFCNKEDYSTTVLKNNLISKDPQLIKVPLLPTIKEVIQLLNTFSHNDLDISDFSVLSYTKPGDGGEGILEKDVVPVFIKEIKSFLDDTNIRTTEGALTTSEDITKADISRDKEHEQMSNFDKSFGKENSFFSIDNNKVKIQIDFETPDKPHNFVDKQDNFYTISKKGDASIEISIEHDGIGEIDIELVLDKGVINAQINASDTHGIEFLEKNLDNIMRALINEGLNIGDFSISLQNKRGMAEMYENKREDIQNIRVTKTADLPVLFYNENLISIFV
ncbi:MAG: flagellar hook-length control protein FliK [Thermodesulfovibrionales bacterium]